MRIDMRKWLTSFWENYKYRFVPWIIVNLKQKRKPNPESHKANVKGDIKVVEQTEQNAAGVASSGSMIVHHVNQGADKLLSDNELVNLLVKTFERLLETENLSVNKSLRHQEISKRNKESMHSALGYSVERRKSLVGEHAGTGVFLASGHAKPGSLIALYPGTIYMPSEPLFFQSLGNPFVFRCSDNVHIDGNDKWISRSVFKSCAARDKFRVDLPCCDESWLTQAPVNPLNIGQYVNNRSKTQENNVVYQESQLTFCFDHITNQSSDDGSPIQFPITLCKYLPNVWANPTNNHHPLRVVPLVAVKEINEGDEILSSYFTVVHAEKNVQNIRDS